MEVEDETAFLEKREQSIIDLLLYGIIPREENDPAEEGDTSHRADGKNVLPEEGEYGPDEERE